MREDSIARTLGVGTLVRGQLRVAGEQMRLTVTMIEGSTGKQLETTRIDGPRGNVFELQDSLSAQMAIFLRERIGQEVKRVEERGGTKVVEAWELVQRAEQTAAGAQQLVADNNLHSALELIASADSLPGFHAAKSFCCCLALSCCATRWFLSLCDDGVGYANAVHAGTVWWSF